ncbi:tRNA nucleotidyltransferase/polyA polymerase family member protein [Theileria equi strain WA]|uniref:tRNA nucleotidyltransferase/polyA polymerase family member protein n=1 Tax=Theileria equi strain WA TaxID=1537102 RepID=L1LD94_THEEQ|nr:tRNA nucleotidyltransferase/polyA polymerase family member protein [Theileria equi strain WA]EKX73301.1 tRNA nucleotidyltransferase/polyA polymerase family member protein [Theileria equi strain WA]|eukprot:XP_004832753.1 tRNA nucleotidyltransferase/polyA polymerase family member protein [Theileria equi strain WA]
MNYGFIQRFSGLRHARRLSSSQIGDLTPGYCTYAYKLPARSFVRRFSGLDDRYTHFLSLSSGNDKNMESYSACSDESTEASSRFSLDIHGKESHPTGQKATITITESEKRLFDLLLGCVEVYSLNMDLRVVGGWVRDKLLNLGSKDIDIALPTMTGVEFCEHLNRYTSEKFGFQRTIGVVKRCPEQSKHLETATMNILGFDVDFVNLRSEDYANNSRIPVMRIGTPFEDAQRRDFTVNAIFYNITRGIIEDFTGFGIEDLHDKVIRTCSPAFETFMDDPLRVIRAIRFTCRLKFDLHKDILDSISNKDVLKALNDKVSRPRISQEIDGILSKGDIVPGFKLLKDFKVLNLLLGVPDDGTVDKQSRLSDNVLVEGCRLMESLKTLIRDDFIDEKYIYLAALVAPTIDMPNIGKMTVAEYLIKERFKLPNKYASSAEAIAQGSVLFENLVDALPTDELDLRQALGLAIRKAGLLWKESLLLHFAKRPEPDADAVYEKFSSIISLAEKLGVNDTYNIKAMITGQELLNILPRLKGGPTFKEVLESQVALMIRDVNITKDNLELHLRETFREFL